MNIKTRIEINRSICTESLSRVRMDFISQLLPEVIDDPGVLVDEDIRTVDGFQQSKKRHIVNRENSSICLLVVRRFVFVLLILVSFV